MHAHMQRLLFAIVAAIAAIDVAWGFLGHFDVDVWAYARLAALSVALAAGGVYYQRVRRSDSLAAMLSATAFLIAFSAGFSLLNYFLLTIAGARIDDFLAEIDRSMGVNWPAMIAFASRHPLANLVLHVLYVSLLPQIAILAVCLAGSRHTAETYKFCVALAAGAGMTVAFWTLFPSFGAFSIYDVPHALSARLNLELDGTYAHDLVRLLMHGPGRISPGETKGLIGFPSYHATMAALVTWYARPLRWLRWPFLFANIGVLIATPIHGGHHVVDVVAGIAVAVFAAWASASLARGSRSTAIVPDALAGAFEPGQLGQTLATSR